MTSLPTRRSQGFSGKSMTILAATVPSGFQSWRRCDRRSHGSQCCCNRSCVDVCPNRSGSDPDKSAPSLVWGGESYSWDQKCRSIQIPPVIPITVINPHSVSFAQLVRGAPSSAKPSSPVWVPHLRRLHVWKQHTRIGQQSIVLGELPSPKGTREPWSTHLLDLMTTTRQEAAIWCSPALESASKITWQWCSWKTFPLSHVPTLNRLTTNVLP